VSEVYDREPDFFKLYRMLQAYRLAVALFPGSEFPRLAAAALSVGDITN
jgi:hypothetical protein